MFGIGGGEFVLIMLVILMFFGSDKIPEIARTLGKGIAQLKNATNDIKSEIHKGMESNGLDSQSIKSLTGGINEEIMKAKEGFTKMVNDSQEHSGVKSELDQIRENFAKINPIESPETVVNTPQANELGENPEGPVKRQS